MKYIIGNRGCGATTQLLMESEKFNIPILCVDKSQVICVEGQARKEGYSIPIAVTVEDLHVRRYDKILIDNYDLLLKQLLTNNGFHGEIISAGITCDNLNFYNKKIK